MRNAKTPLLPKVATYINRAVEREIPVSRKALLRTISEFIREKNDRNEEAAINFICTHNSRRSQLSQVWATVAAASYGVKLRAFSGGVEVTSFNKRVAAALERAGIKVHSHGHLNPEYSIRYSLEAEPVTAYSKRVDDPSNPSAGFAAVMTCAHADETCPVIPGAEMRISLPYKDPGEYDNTSNEAQMYDERCMQIAAEMMYVFSQIGT